jgi:hypothetical protein
MSYLIQTDYNKQIQTDNLNQIIGSDQSVLSSAELAAQEEVTSYLTQKYDLSQEFKDLFPWDATKAYKATDRVSDKGIIYYASYPQPPFNYLSLYKKNDQAFWKDKTYACLVNTPVLSHETLIQQSQINQQALNTQLGLNVINVFPDDPVNGAQNWGAGVAYSVSAGTALSDSTKWTKADNRSQQMVMVMIDIVLYHVHSRISPRNIPELRVKRYDEAIAWLKKAGKGDITANLPIRQVKTGNRIRYGGNPKLSWKY